MHRLSSEMCQACLGKINKHGAYRAVSAENHVLVCYTRNAGGRQCRVVLLRKAMEQTFILKPCYQAGSGVYFIMQRHIIFENDEMPDVRLQGSTRYDGIKTHLFCNNDPYTCFLDFVDHVAAYFAVGNDIVDLFEITDLTKAAPVKL